MLSPNFYHSAVGLNPLIISDHFYRL